MVVERDDDCIPVRVCPLPKVTITGPNTKGSLVIMDVNNSVCYSQRLVTENRGHCANRDCASIGSEDQRVTVEHDQRGRRRPNVAVEL